MMWIAIFAFFLLAGYFIYGRTIEKNWDIDIYRNQSDWQEDESVISHFGFRYVQIAQFAILLSFEMLISAVYGYAYGLAYVFWLIVGTIFFGGALSYYGGMYALRHHGYTLNYAVKQHIGKFAHFCTTILLLGLIVALLVDSYKSFSLVYEKVFELPAHLLLVYCAVVALFFSFCSARQMALIFAGIGIFAVFVLCILLFGSKLQLGMVEYGAHNFVLNDLKYAYPLAFFVITLGSINCLQGLQASLLAPMIKNEKVGRRVFFGAAVFQGLFLILFNILIAAWNPNINEFYASLFDNPTPYISLQNVAFGAGGKQATLLLFVLGITLFLGFVGAMTRLARNLISETKVGQFRFLAGIFTLLFVMLPAFGLQYFSLKFEYVLICTQIAGLFSCFVLAFVLKTEGKKCYHIIWPAALVLSALVAYVLLVILGLPLLISNLVGGGLFVLVLLVHILSKNKETFKNKWQQIKEKHAVNKEIRAQKRAQEKLQKQQAKELKKQEAEDRKREKAELKKQEAEKKKQATLALMLAQDETEGKANREVELEKEIVKLQAERDKINQRVKEIEQELEKEQSKRLLLETSESVVEKIEQDETTDNLIDEMEKLDTALTATDDNFDIENLIDEDDDKEKSVESKQKFDFDDDLETDFKFEEDTKPAQAEKTSEQPISANKKKRNRKRNKKNKETQTS